MTRKRDLRTRLRAPERERAASSFVMGFTGKWDKEAGNRTRVRLARDGSLEMTTTLSNRSFLDGLIESVIATFANEGWEVPEQPSQHPMRDLSAFRALEAALTAAPHISLDSAAFSERLKRAMIHELAMADSPESQAKIVYSSLLRARELQDCEPRRAIDYLSFAAWKIAELVMLLERQPRKDGVRNKLANDPTQGPKEAIYKVWRKWNTDRRAYPRPRDFRKAMLTRYTTVADGTLKNWMSDWPRGKNLPKQSSRC